MIMPMSKKRIIPNGLSILLRLKAGGGHLARCFVIFGIPKQKFKK